MASHIHAYSEILYCQGGSCKALINGREVCLNGNEFVFVPPNYIHQYVCADSSVICAVFSNDFIPLFFKAIKDKKPIVKKYDAGELKSVFERLPELDKSNPLLTSAYLNLICSRVIEQGSFEAASSTDDELYQRVISYIADNFTEDVSLKTLARQFGYNEKYLSSVLHSLTGIHFSEFAAMYRIEYAKELLTKDSGLSVAEIAMQCGFKAVNTFNRRFKALTAMTPKEYKKIYSIAEKR